MLAFSGIYSLDGGEFWKIFLIDPATQALEEVPVPEARECTHPCWSPDQQHLVFTAAQRAINGASAVFLFDRHKRMLQQLTHEAVHFGALDWTRDGQAIVISEPAGTAWFLSLLDVSGHIQRLFNITDWLYYALSLLNHQIVFVPKADNSHIYLSNSTGSGQRLLINEPFPYASDLVWSPDGEQIAFTTYEGDTIYLNTIHIRSAEHKRFGSLAYNVQFAWSPTSEYIAYLGDGDQSFALYTVNVQDATTTYLADIHAGDESGEIRPTNPVWSADGQEIAFSTFDKSSVFQIYCIDKNGASRKVITPPTPTFDLIYDLSWH